VRQVLRARQPAAHVSKASFGANGRMLRSGLPMMRHAPDALPVELVEEFTMLSRAEQVHHRPSGADQPFIHWLCRKAQA